MKRLQLSEVESEKARRSRWEEALRKWRILHTHHAMRLLNERIRSPEFAEPSSRLALFSTVGALGGHLQAPQGHLHAPHHFWAP